MPSASCSIQIQNSVSTSKNLLKKKKLNFSCNTLSNKKTRVCLKSFMNDCRFKTYSWSWRALENLRKNIHVKLVINSVGCLRGFAGYEMSCEAAFYTRWTLLFEPENLESVLVIYTGNAISFMDKNNFKHKKLLTHTYQITQIIPTLPRVKLFIIGRTEVNFLKAKHRVTQQL